MDKPSTAQGTPTSAAFPRAKTRVGIIEVGSRATRLLVADVQGADVNPVKSTSRSIALAKALAASPQQALVTLKDVKRTILGLKAEARQSNANIIRCFGTAAMRRLNEKLPAAISFIDDTLQVLSPGEEAECSFVAAVTDPAVEPKPDHAYVVLDMGGGSIEVVSGRTRNSVPAIKDQISCDLGSARVSEQLSKASYDLEKFEGWLDQELERFTIFAPVIGADTILLGSVPTKIAWLQVRRSSTDIYNPRLVAGANLDRDQARAMAQEIMSVWRQDPDVARKFVDPRFSDDSELKLVVSGLVLLEKILSRQQRKNCRVSARGTRFGFALMLAARQAN